MGGGGWPGTRPSLRARLDADGRLHTSSFTGTWSATDLYSGRSFVVTVPPQYVGAGRPAGVVFGAGRWDMSVWTWWGFALAL